MAISKITLNGVTQMDVTQDTVTANTLLSAYTATRADGEKITGTATAGEDIPKFTIVLNNGEIESVTCNKSAWAVSQYWSNHSYTATALMTDGLGTEYGYASVDLLKYVIDDTHGNYVYCVVYNPDGAPFIDLKYNENSGTIEVIDPSSMIVDHPTPTIEVNAQGTITAGAFQSSDGYVSAGGYESYYQLPTQSATTITPSTSAQTAVTAGKYTTGAVTVAAMPTGTAGTPTATKGTVSNHAVTVTPSVTNTTGYITGGTINGTGVSVTASELVSGSETKTANGTYDVTNLAEVVVNVSGGGSAVIQPLSVTSNGTYTAPSGVDGYSPVTVNVSGGSTTEGVVRFIDYDGTVLHTYTPAEFLALTAMPANPSHTGLTAQGWNWSLTDAKSYVTDYPEADLNIEQMYVTDDGKTRLYIHIDNDTPDNRMTFYVRFTSSVANNVTLDWGDGTVETKGATSATSYPHTYATTGDYMITLTVNSGTISFVGSSSYAIYGGTSTTYSYNRGRIRKAEIGSGVTSIGNYAFYYCYSLTSITIPDSVTSIGSYVFQNCYALISITIPDGVTSIGLSTFIGCYSLTSLTIPDGVTSIGNSTFQNCYSLTSLTIPDSVTSIGNYAFSQCYSLTSITIPDSVTSIGNNAFHQCYSLTSLTIPDGVTSISASTFSSCYSLTPLTIPDGVTSIGNNAFQNCYSLTSLTIPDSVTSIGNSVFQNCYALISITIPDGVTSIGASTFSSCNALTSLTIPDGVTSIESYAFNQCYSLTSITIPDSVTSIENNAFYQCYSLTSLTIPDGVTSIGNTAFYACYSFTSITIPDGVTSIGTSVFTNCYGVSEYHLLPTTPPTLAGTNAFTGIASDCIIYVPYSADGSILAAYQAATNWSTYASKMQEEPQ